ncbi:MAG: hypothetical protein OHK0022_29760 [Roseiflexaceae bacterium]
MSFRAEDVQSSHFAHDGRGPSLGRWLRDSDLCLPNSEAGFAPFTGSIVGAQYRLPPVAYGQLGGAAWVVFHGLQVIQIVPEEVHSYWHRAQLTRQRGHSGAWEIVDSPWLASFNPRHLADTRHVVLEFYDDIVEVICRELVFGAGMFSIQAAAEGDPRFARALLRHAQAQTKLGNLAEAAASLQKYINRAPEQRDRDYAQRLLETLGAG